MDSCISYLFGNSKLIIVGLTETSAIRGVQVKYYETYISTVRNILRRTTKKCSVYVSAA